MIELHFDTMKSYVLLYCYCTCPAHLFLAAYEGRRTSLRCWRSRRFVIGLFRLCDPSAVVVVSAGMVHKY